MKFVLALALLLLTANAAEAKGHHHAARHDAIRIDAHRQPVRLAVPRAESHWWSGGASSLVAEARSQIGNGAIYGRTTLWCARFVNFILKATGHRVTDSDMASSFAHYGTRIRGPQIGAIAVMSRRGGGHVGVVSGVDAAGNPIVISGNHGHRVAEAIYPRGRIYAYVLPN
jgi:uncharacterized protein (TIGR02594 family)